jgi:hypothetical protein
MNATNKNTPAVLKASMEAGLEVNTEIQVYGYVSSPKCRTKP